MLRKNISAVKATILSAFLFIIIGSCFSAFMYKSEIVKVKNPSLILAEGITIFNESGDKTIEQLSLSKMKLGLKPATGEEDGESKIPITITDKQGSEGLYAKFRVYAPNGAIIKIKNINIKSKENKDKIDKEKENIKVAIKESLNSVVSLNSENLELCAIDKSEEKQLLTFFVWLSKDASDILKASTISFELSFENL